MNSKNRPAGGEYLPSGELHPYSLKTAFCYVEIEQLKKICQSNYDLYNWDGCRKSQALYKAAEYVIKIVEPDYEPIFTPAI